MCCQQRPARRLAALVLVALAGNLALVQSIRVTDATLIRLFKLRPVQATSRHRMNNADGALFTNGRRHVSRLWYGVTCNELCKIDRDNHVCAFGHLSARDSNVHNHSWIDFASGNLLPVEILPTALGALSANRYANMNGLSTKCNSLQGPWPTLDLGPPSLTLLHASHGDNTCRLTRLHAQYTGSPRRNASL